MTIIRVVSAASRRISSSSMPMPVSVSVQVQNLSTSTDKRNTIAVINAAVNAATAVTDPLSLPRAKNHHHQVDITSVMAAAAVVPTGVMGQEHLHRELYGPSEFLVQYFNFGYYLRFIPYRFGKEAGLVEGNLIHKVWCGFVHILVIYYYLAVAIRGNTGRGALAEALVVDDEVPKELQEDGAGVIGPGPDPLQNPTSIFFAAVADFSSLFYKFVFLLSLWQKKSTFLQVLYFIIQRRKYQHQQEERLGQVTGQQRQQDEEEGVGVGSRRLRSSWHYWVRFWCHSRLLSRLVCTVYLGCALLMTFKDVTDSSADNWSLRELVAQNARFTRYLLFIGNSPKLCNATLWPNPAVSQDVALALTGLLTKFYHNIAQFYSDLSIVSCILTFMSLSRHFIGALKASNYNSPLPPPSSRTATRITTSEDAENLLEEFNALKSVGDKLSTAIGPTLFGSIIEALPYYTRYIGDSLIHSPDWVEKVLGLFFFVTYFGTLSTAATVTHQVDKLRDWLCIGTNCQLISQHRLVLILNEIDNHRVGISAMGLCTITFRIIGSFVSFLLTFAVVILQLTK